MIKLVIIKYIILLLTLTSFVLGKCPDDAGAALEPNADLLACDCKTLRKFYSDDDCCIVNLAECNNIERAWEVSRNILHWKPLCPNLRHQMKVNSYQTFN